MSFEITGKLSWIGEVQTFDSGFQKREIQHFVIENQSGEYTNKYAFTLMIDKVSLIDRYGLGDEATVKFSIRCYEHNGKYYTNLNAFYISGEPAQQTYKPQTAVNQNVESAVQNPPPMPDLEIENEDDIPF